MLERRERERGLILILFSSLAKQDNHILSTHTAPAESNEWDMEWAGRAQWKQGNNFQLSGWLWLHLWQVSSLSPLSFSQHWTVGWLGSTSLPTLSKLTQNEALQLTEVLNLWFMIRSTVHDSEYFSDYFTFYLQFIFRPWKFPKQYKCILHLKEIFDIIVV